MGRDLRVEIRPPLATDREPFLAAMRASRRLHGRWLPAMTAESFARMLERVGDERYEPFLVCRRTDGAIAGFFNIGEIVRGQFQSAYLGYGATAELAGQGYMREGLALLLAHAFGPARLHRLEANIQPANARSIALVRRAGFVKEGYSARYLKIGGRWCDHERWAIRAEQWRALRRGSQRS
ncbi:MAG TPA: GNAT family protein [Solirubrobacteraceae bacterium]|nr:GNAT family protein [Solirubrobacteraceae bacterium]